MATVQRSLATFEPYRPKIMKWTDRTENTASGRMSRGRKRERPVDTHLVFKSEHGKNPEMKRVRAGPRSAVRTRSSKRHRSYRGDRTKITDAYLERASRLRRTLRRRT